MPTRFQPRIRFHEGNALSRVRVVRSGDPNPMRSSRPVLTVPLLLRTHHQEEGDGASEREDGTSGVWAPRGSFFVHTRCHTQSRIIRTGVLQTGFHGGGLVDRQGRLLDLAVPSRQHLKEQGRRLHRQGQKDAKRTSTAQRTSTPHGQGSRADVVVPADPRVETA